MSAVKHPSKLNERAFLLLAKSELRLRRKRLAQFGPGWVSDAWWDLLLQIYSSESSANTDYFTLAGELGNSFELTERWLTLLTAHGYVEPIKAAPLNELSGYVLTVTGRRKVEQCLRAAKDITSGTG